LISIVKITANKSSMLPTAKRETKKRLTPKDYSEPALFLKGPR
jgi:hypothetical protein